MFRFGRNGELGNLLWGFVAGELLSLALDVEDERVVVCLVVKLRVIAFAGAAAIKAVKTDVQTARVVDAVEASCAVFAVDAL